MCKDCGCEQAGWYGPGRAYRHSHGPGQPEHEHTQGGGHAHAPDGHTHEPAAPVKRVVEAQINLLEANDRLAAENRAWMKSRGMVAVNIISSPGSGKTRLLEQTLDRLRGKLSCAVIVGDVQTDRDALRLENRGAPVRAIETLGSCHLSAEHIRDALPRCCPEGTRLLFIENVGNLVCPVAFDLGETIKAALLSTTEGEDKPLKYPALFSAAEVVVITKTDLEGAVDWDRSACRKNIEAVHPGVRIVETSAKTGSGMEEWVDYLLRIAAPRPV